MTLFSDEPADSGTESARLHAAATQGGKQVRIFQGNPPGEREIFLEPEVARQVSRPLRGTGNVEQGSLSLQWDRDGQEQVVKMSYEGKPYVAIGKVDAEYLAAEIDQALETMKGRGHWAKVFA
jgi:hypothetical protein